MSTIAHLIKKDIHNTPTIVQSFSFEDYEDACEFMEKFGSRGLYNRIETSYSIELVSALDAQPNSQLVLMLEITIENNRYAGNTVFAIRNSKGFNLHPDAAAAAEAAYLNPKNAYAMNKQGKVIHLEDGNVGIHTFYTCDMSMVEELNEKYC